jgi:P4 family phage/plasmid primase-like protien
MTDIQLEPSNMIISSSPAQKATDIYVTDDTALFVLPGITLDQNIQFSSEDNNDVAFIDKWKNFAPLNSNVRVQAQVMKGPDPKPIDTEGFDTWIAKPEPKVIVPITPFVETNVAPVETTPVTRPRLFPSTIPSSRISEIIKAKTKEAIDFMDNLSESMLIPYIGNEQAIDEAVKEIDFADEIENREHVLRIVRSNAKDHLLNRLVLISNKKGGVPVREEFVGEASPTQSLPAKITLEQYCSPQPGDSDLEQEFKLKFYQSIIGATHADVARCFNAHLRRSGACLMHVSEGIYYTWDIGIKLWKIEARETIMCRLFDNLTSLYDTVARRIDTQRDNQDIRYRQVRNIAKLCDSEGFRNSTFRILSGYITDNNFKKDLNSVTPWIPTRDGKICNIHTGDLRDRVPSDRYTLTVNATYRSDFSEADLAEVNMLFDQLMCGDPEMAAYLPVLLAIYISGNLVDKSYAIFSGSGDNGKSVLMRFMIALLGNYYHAASSGIFVRGRTGAVNAHTSHLNSMVSKRLSVLNDGTNGMNVINGEQIKTLTGDDAFATRRLQQEESNDGSGVRTTSHCVLICNDPPQIVADQALKNRTRMIKFNAKFVRGLTVRTGNNYPADPKIDSKLATEHNLDALFTLLVRGGMEYYRRGFEYPVPKAVIEATSAYLATSFAYYDFLTDCIEITGDRRDKISSQELFSMYESYAGRRADSKRKFGLTMAQMKNEIPKDSSDGGYTYYFRIKARQNNVTFE